MLFHLVGGLITSILIARVVNGDLEGLSENGLATNSQ
jgi:hypothetical protein